MESFGGANRNAGAGIELPPQLLEPTYQNRLRIVGWRLDYYQLHSPTIIESDGGFVIRAYQAEGCQPLLMEIFDREFPQLIRQAATRSMRDEGAVATSELIPTGYEDLLRAVGYELDERVGENVVIAEYPGFICVSGYEPAFDTGAERYRMFSEVLTSAETRQILDEALLRRGTYRVPRIYIPPSLRDEYLDGGTP